MSEQPPEEPRTGNQRVDEVLESLEGLEDRPVDEHVAVFEEAQRELRAALDEEPDS